MEHWLQNYDPLGNAFLSTIVAALPVVAHDDRAGALRRHLGKEVLLSRLTRLDAGAELDARIRLFNLEPDRLDAVAPLSAAATTAGDSSFPHGVLSPCDSRYHVLKSTTPLFWASTPSLS